MPVLSIRRFHIPNALGEQETLDTVHVGRSLVNEPIALAMRSPGVLFFNGQNANLRTDVSFAPIDSGQRAKHRQGVNAIRLDPPGPAIDLQTCRIKDADIIAFCL
jgi:hypothetical protein